MNLCDASIVFFPAPNVFSGRTTFSVIGRFFSIQGSQPGAVMVDLCSELYHFKRRGGSCFARDLALVFHLWFSGAQRVGQYYGHNLFWGISASTSARAHQTEPTVSGTRSSQPHSNDSGVTGTMQWPASGYDTKSFFAARNAETSPSKGA